MQLTHDNAWIPPQLVAEEFVQRNAEMFLTTNWVKEAHLKAFMEHEGSSTSLLQSSSCSATDDDPEYFRCASPFDSGEDSSTSTEHPIISHALQGTCQATGYGGQHFLSRCQNSNQRCRCGPVTARAELRGQ